jgi:hypothetical protein
MLLETYELLRKEEGEPDVRTAMVVHALVNHYEATGQPEKAKEYQAILESLP